MPHDQLLSTAETPEQAIRDSVRRFTAQHSSFRRIREQRGNLPGFSRDLWRQMADLGWFGTLIAEDDGGMGLGLAEAAAIAEGLATCLCPEPFSGSAMLTTAILRDCQGSVRDDLLSTVVAGETVVAVAWQEDTNSIAPSHGATRVTTDGATAVIAGTKRFVHAGAGADGFIVAAQQGPAVALWWVPAGSVGVTVVADRLADGTFAATVTFADARVPDANCLAGTDRASAILTAALDLTTILASAEMLAVATVAFDMTLEHLRTRKQFGATIGSFQALQHRAVDCGAQLELARGVLRDAIQVAGETTDPVARAVAASRTKARCAEAAGLVAREGIQMFGAMGFTDDLDLSLCVKRILVLAAWLGAAHHHRRRFASLRVPVLATDETRSAVNPHLTATQINSLLSDIYGPSAARVALHPRHPRVTS